ncbi:hypothetical protein [Psychrobacillus sp. BM2]|uniref:hypothetical protein n=1 Tax=Psychrobacillus sp. BM2 TaxID=3400421 RepID=UPI003B0125E1
MGSLTAEQKKELIVIAEKSYLLAVKVRRENGDSFDVYGSKGHPLKDSCYNVSSLIYHIVKNEYGLTNEDNKVYDCLIVLGEGTSTYTNSHYINKVCGEYIDASIGQFNDQISDLELSPYDNNEQYYKEIKEKEPLDTDAIREEIDAYEFYSGIPQSLKLKPVKKQSFIGKFMSKIFL